MLAGFKLLMSLNYFGLRAYIGMLSLFFGKMRVILEFQKLAHHPLVQKWGASIGVPNMADLIDATISRMKAKADPEAEDWQRFIQNYGEIPAQDAVPAFLDWLGQSGLLRDQHTELPMAAAALSLAERHPDRMAAWGKDFGDVFEEAKKVLLRCAPDRPNWNDFHMVRWLVLRQDEIVQELAKRAGAEGIVGQSCSWMLASVERQNPPFAAALRRVGWEPPEPTVAPVIPQPPPIEYDPIEAHRQANVLQHGMTPVIGATINSVLVEEDPANRWTTVTIHTTRGRFQCQSPYLNVILPNMTEQETFAEVMKEAPKCRSNKS
jgi:hypothetical protein